tara:strand:- start:172 stop:441 length:270 start_codon:yes stop_codon:yes gene_type:complete
LHDYFKSAATQKIIKRQATKGAGKIMNNSQFKREQAGKHNMKRIETAAYEMDKKLFPKMMLSGNSQSRYEKRKAAAALAVLAVTLGVTL